MRYSLALVVALALGCLSQQAPTSASTLRLTPELHLGGADEGVTSFADLRAFTVDRSGRIYVLEAQAQEVRVFDSTGAFLRQIGRRGSGPGEFRMANGIALGGDDHLWVYDPGNSRATEFDTAGVLERTYSLSLSGYGFVWEGGVDRMGRLYDQDHVPAGDTTVAVIRRIVPTTGRTETLLWPHCAAPSEPAYRFPRGSMGVPYAGGPFRRIDLRGFTWCADSRRMTFYQYRMGDTVPIRTFTADVDPSPVTPAERDSAVARVQAFMKRVGSASPDFGLIPSIKPVLLGIDPDDRGRIWATVEARTGMMAMVFDSAGPLRAQVLLPFKPSPWIPLIVRGDHLYAVTRDSLDVQGIVRYQIN